MSYTLGNRFKIRPHGHVSLMRKWRHTEPTHLTTSAPPLDGVTIMSGMVVTLDVGTFRGVPTTGWRVANSDDAGVSSVYIAMQDSYPDAVTCGALLALPFRTAAELRTGYVLFPEEFDAVTPGLPLTTADDGYLTPADEDDFVVARVSVAGPQAGGLFSALTFTPNVHVENNTMIQIILGEEPTTTQSAPGWVDNDGAAFHDDGGYAFV